MIGKRMRENKLSLGCFLYGFRGNPCRQGMFPDFILVIASFSSSVLKAAIFCRTCMFWEKHECFDYSFLFFTGISYSCRFLRPYTTILYSSLLIFLSRSLHKFSQLFLFDMLINFHSSLSPFYTPVQLFVFPLHLDLCFVILFSAII